MLAFVIFIISLAVIAFSLVMKSREIYNGRKIFLANWFARGDDWILKTILKIRYWWSHVNFRNTKRVIFWTITTVHKIMVAVKRRFDHKQSHFFTKREHTNIAKNPSSVSFFLKDVSDYKKRLREGREE